uniref:Nucleotidyltransferase domain-containing protein n=1 Tax=Geobacter metallireducens TaxID=28232 RepID=A0A831U386_GEOME
MIKFEQLPDNIHHRLTPLANALEQDSRVVFAYLFGGLAGGQQRPLSDVDIAVYLNDSANRAEAKLELFSTISDILGTSELDVVILNGAPLSLAGRVLRRKRLLVDKEPFVRHRYESVILREFFDFSIKEGNLFSARYGHGG